MIKVEVDIFGYLKLSQMIEFKLKSKKLGVAIEIFGTQQGIEVIYKKGL